MNAFLSKFEPLTETERAALSAGDEGECVMPVPSDAPPVPDAHPKWGKHSSRWPYHDADGALLFEVWRFDPDDERKQFLPLSFWREPSGALRWLWKAVPPQDRSTAWTGWRPIPARQF